MRGLREKYNSFCIQAGGPCRTMKEHADTMKDHVTAMKKHAPNLE